MATARQLARRGDGRLIEASLTVADPSQFRVTANHRPCERCSVFQTAEPVGCVSGLTSLKGQRIL